MDISLIVAKYTEDISWINTINNSLINKIVVYNKFHKIEPYLPNVGREGHTYLYHIINNYNNLSDYTIFCQGDPIFHCNNFLDLIHNKESYSKDIMFLCPQNYENIYGNFDKAHPTGLPMYYFFDLLFNIKLSINEKLKVYYGAQFIVHKQNITNRPKEFYEFLIKFLSYETNPIEGYIIERLWPYILDTKIILSDKYKLWMK